MLEEDVQDSEHNTTRFVIMSKEPTHPEAENGQVITRTSSVGVEEWSLLGEGSSVAVVYFPLYPIHNRLDEFVPAQFRDCVAKGANSGQHQSLCRRSALPHRTSAPRCR